MRGRVRAGARCRATQPVASRPWCSRYPPRYPMTVTTGADGVARCPWAAPGRVRPLPRRGVGRRPARRRAALREAVARGVPVRPLLDRRAAQAAGLPRRRSPGSSRSRWPPSATTTSRGCSPTRASCATGEDRGGVDERPCRRRAPRARRGGRPRPARSGRMRPSRATARTGRRGWATCRPRHPVGRAGEGPEGRGPDVRRARRRSTPSCSPRASSTTTCRAASAPTPRPDRRPSPRPTRDPPLGLLPHGQVPSRASSCPCGRG